MLTITELHKAVAGPLKTLLFENIKEQRYFYMIWAKSECVWLVSDHNDDTLYTGTDSEQALQVYNYGIATESESYNFDSRLQEEIDGSHQ